MRQLVTIATAAVFALGVVALVGARPITAQDRRPAETGLAVSALPGTPIAPASPSVRALPDAEPAPVAPPASPAEVDVPPASAPPAAPVQRRPQEAARPAATALPRDGLHRSTEAVHPVADKRVPVRIRIAAIGVSAPVDPLDLRADGTLDVPDDFSRTGYYIGRPAPGEIGPAVIVGHVSSRRGPAVFYGLSEVKPGIEVVVERADGRAVVFAVERVEQHPKDRFPTQSVYGPTPEPTLRLITCGGTFDRSKGSHRDNVVVFLGLVR